MMGRTGTTEAFTVVFDLDGTLVDTMRGIASNLHAMCNELGSPPLTEAEFLERFASRFDAVFTELSVRDGRPRDSVFAEWVKRTARRPERPAPFEGVATLIESLERANAELYLWTTRDGATTRDLLASAGWARAFTDCRCGDSGAPPKPAPDALESMLGPHRPPERVAIVGDGLSDIEAGKAFGCRTVGAAWCSLASAARLAAAGADAIAESPERCSEILLSLFDRPSPRIGGG